MRTLFYWLTTTAIAVLATHASDHPDEVTQLLWTPDVHVNVLPVPEPSRAVLLGVGIMALAFTYRRAWLNLKRKD